MKEKEYLAERFETYRSHLLRGGLPDASRSSLDPHASRL